MMQNAGLVFLGGGLGAVCRYLVTMQIGARFSTMFPWGTLSVNLLGSLLMGWILGLILLLTERTGSGLGEAARLLLTVGFLGGFTTFSSFSMETLTLLRGGSLFYALANIGMNVILGLLAAWLGLSLSRML